MESLVGERVRSLVNEQSSFLLCLLRLAQGYVGGSGKAWKLMRERSWMLETSLSSKKQKQ